MPRARTSRLTAAAAVLALCASLAAALAFALASAPAGDAAAPAVGAAPAAHAAAQLTTAASGPPKPVIIQKLVPFGDARKAQTAAYCKKRYHLNSSWLVHPKVIVLHFTSGPDLMSAWNTFASNSAYMGEKPGVSAHFLIDKSGAIYQCVPLALIARHAIGLNYTAVGIEFVQEVAKGKTGHWADQQILSRTKQVNAGLTLVRWLKARYHIGKVDVIGHAMANSSPYFKDFTGVKNATGDWVEPDILAFRARL